MTTMHYEFNLVNRPWRGGDLHPDVCVRMRCTNAMRVIQTIL